MNLPLFTILLDLFNESLNLIYGSFRFWYFKPMRLFDCFHLIH